MAELINPDFKKSLGEVSLILYNNIEVHLPIKDWQFLCDKRWFSDNPALEVVEAEFGLYNARQASNSSELLQCIKACISDYKEIMGVDVEGKSNNLLDSNLTTFLTLDSQGNIIVKGEQR